METSNSSKNDKIKIAIFGGGISGCSCAYFLKEIFGDKLDLTVFEKTNQIGGRLETISFKERNYELGGSILHSSNLYMKQFIKYLGLEKKKDSTKNIFLGLYDSKGIFLKLYGNFYGIVDKIKMLHYFGFFQMIRFIRFVENFTDRFSRIYKLQENGFTFKNDKEFLSKIDKELYDVSQFSLKNVLEKKKFNKRIINYLTNAACLTNYGQSNLIDGFVGLVSLAGTVGDLWCVKNGNKQVPINLLEKSGAKVLKNTRVKSISMSLSNPDTKNMIVYETEDNVEMIDDSFDYVIIGFPIYNGIMGHDFNIDFETKSSFEGYRMQRTIHYFINGIVKKFSDIPNDRPIQIHSTDPSISFREIFVQLPCDYENSKDLKLFQNNSLKLHKVSAQEEMTTKDFDKIFDSGYEIIKEMPWNAYPKYNENPTSKTIPPIILDSESRERVYYLNAMEWTSSCMEISSISARNISLLIANKEKELLEGKKPKKFFNKSFLKEESLGRNSLLHGTCALLAFLSIIAFSIAVFIGK